MADLAWVALSLTRQIGGKTFRALLSQFNHDLNAILAADEADLRAMPGIGIKTAHAILHINLEAVEERVHRWQKAGVQIITWNDPHYPPSLKAVDDAPPTLYVRGTLPSFNRAYAIVGTRTPAAESAEIASSLAHNLALSGGVIVSGLALGIDHEAHLGALAVQGNNTVAVLGSGVLNIYPPENEKLAEALINHGALISEVAPDSNVSTPGLVARNRIISGLSQAVIIVETGLGGGAMHTARFAKIQGRPLYAIENDASGNRALLADGARPVSSTASEIEL